MLFIKYLEIPTCWEWISESHIWRSRPILWMHKWRRRYCWSKYIVFEVWMWSGGLAWAQQVGSNTAESCKVGEEGGHGAAEQTVGRAWSRALIDNTHVRLHRSRPMPCLWLLELFLEQRQTRSSDAFPFVQLFLQHCFSASGVNQRSHKHAHAPLNGTTADKHARSSKLDFKWI